MQGNRVGFWPSDSEVDLHFTTAADEPLSLALLAPALLQWRERGAAALEVLTAAVVDTLASAGAGEPRQARDRGARCIDLPAGLRSDGGGRDPHAAFQAVGRRHRGVAAVAIVMPKVLPIGALDQVGFGYAFYPIRNPRFSGENPVRLG